MQDLEIYIRDLKPAQLSAWLGQNLDSLNLDDSDVNRSVVKGQASYRGSRVGVILYPGAFGKRYGSLILEGDELPWATDLEFARNAWRALGTEIRCSTGDWQEGQPVDEERWWRLDDRGEEQVVWN
ncbi:hypothetical protein [Marinobacter salicampi]|uniref:hypothetical protein n=1 Tax=Marinobacter salicampi TaxID=435907 RepID=UPI00140D76A8|nr:hypothetical protein [Marinobacter salicampi]